MDLVKAYQQKDYDEEIKYLAETLGGVDELAHKLKTDPTDGIHVTTVEELDERDEVFGTNKKDPFKRTRKKTNAQPSGSCCGWHWTTLC